MKKWFPLSTIKATFILPDLAKKIFIAVCLVGFNHIAWSQSYDMGLKGAIGPAYFFNENFLKSGAEEHYRFTLSDNFGLHGAINFNRSYGLEMDIVTGDLRQGYGGSFDGGSYTSSVEISVIQIPLILRYTRESGKYIEIGMGYEIISGATYSAEYSNPSASINTDVSKQYPGNSFLLMAGLGRDRRLSHESNFYLKTSVRLTYDLYDLQGVDGHGQDLAGPSSVLYSSNSYYRVYHSTHAIDLSLNIGIFYRFYPNNIHKKEVDF
jgi:hypothetical protein